MIGEDERGQTPVSIDDLLRRVPAGLREQAAQVGAARLGRMLAVLDQRMTGVVPVAEAVRRRHNVSAILRSADAFGLHEAHLVSGSDDDHRSFRPSPGAARGAERWMKVVLHGTTTGAVAQLRSRGFRIFVADLSPSFLLPEEIPVDRPVAVVFGSEVAGVSAEATGLADGVVGLAMRGFGESLNVSVAAATILRAVADRRRALSGPDLSEETRFEALESWISREESYRSAATRRVGSPGEGGR
jgi:tRNA (guanosine-2'-O-)-methyltransferase